MLVFYLGFLDLVLRVMKVPFFKCVGYLCSANASFLNEYRVQKKRKIYFYHCIIKIDYGIKDYVGRFTIS